MFNLKAFGLCAVFLVGAGGLGYASVRMMRGTLPMQTSGERTSGMVPTKGAHARAVTELLELRTKIDAKEAEIVRHDESEDTLDTSDFEATKAYVTRSWDLTTERDALAERYEVIARALGCHYPGPLTVTRPDGVRVTLPCHR